MRCKGETKAGKRCPFAPTAGKAYCHRHDPDLGAQRARAGRKGFKNRQGQNGHGEPPKRRRPTGSAEMLAAGVQGIVRELLREELQRMFGGLKRG